MEHSRGIYVSVVFSDNTYQAVS